GLHQPSRVVDRYAPVANAHLLRSPPSFPSAVAARPPNPIRAKPIAPKAITFHNPFTSFDPFRPALTLYGPSRQRAYSDQIDKLLLPSTGPIVESDLFRYMGRKAQ